MKPLSVQGTKVSVGIRVVFYHLIKRFIPLIYYFGMLVCDKLVLGTLVDG